MISYKPRDFQAALTKLYARFGITDATDYGKKLPTDFPIMQDFYKLCEEEFMTYDKSKKYLYTEETLQEVSPIRGSRRQCR